jgi:Tfp pilus assembly PilM family ATPase
LRLNGITLLNQDVKEFVLDCEKIEKKTVEGGPVRYLVCGLPRTRVTEIDEAFQAHRKNSVRNVQVAPVCSFNAFEFANPETFNNEGFLLVDFGHTTATITVGAKRELILVRALEYGAQTLLDALIAHGAKNREEALRQLEENDEVALECARLSLTVLTRSITSSIGFFEGRHEENIAKIFVSGAIARSKALLNILSEELHIPCESWDPFKSCEVSLPAARRQTIAEDFVSLNVACGAAAEALKGN